MNSSLSPTSPAASLNQPTHSLAISLIGFPQMTVLVSEQTATNSLPQLQHWESPASSGPVSQSAVTLQSNSANSWRCNSFQRPTTSPPSWPISFTATKPSYYHTASHPRSPPLRSPRVPSHPPHYYVPLRSACGIYHRPNTRGGRWVIPVRGLLKCF